MTITNQHIIAFIKHLHAGEYAPGTIEKYTRDAERFRAWLGSRALTREETAAWKSELLRSDYASVTMNSIIVAVNQFLKFLGREDCRVKELRIQRRLFRSTEKEMTKEEYVRLTETAASLGKERLSLLMETICATGIRVSEVKYITVEALRMGKAEVNLKGKIRTILLPNKLCRKLQKYAKKRKIASGEVFLTGSGRGLTRRQIWAEMKGLCKKAGVAPSKVFPHNLRHLFARTFYRACRDVALLADILGHSSIETTRIYLISTGAEHSSRLERLGLVF